MHASAAVTGRALVLQRTMNAAGLLSKACKDDALRRADANTGLVTLHILIAASGPPSHVNSYLVPLRSAVQPAGEAERAARMKGRSPLHKVAKKLKKVFQHPARV